MTPVPSKDINSVTPEQLADILAGPPEHAAAWLHAAAEGGVTQAQLMYGQMLLDGRGVPADPGQAVFWFKRAARTDDPVAMNLLGQCYLHGRGVAPSPVMAAHWHLLAAQAGLDWGMYNYATALALGSGVDEDRKEALTWLSKAAALGHAKSLNVIGGIHEDGSAGSVDISLAFDYYHRAAEAGDFRGQFNLARLLADRGEMTEAVRWMRKLSRTAPVDFLEKTRDFLQQSPHLELQAMTGWFETRIMQAAASPPMPGASADGSANGSADGSASGLAEGSANPSANAPA